MPTESSPARPFAIAFSFPKERREYVERVAKALLPAFGGEEQGKARIFYDQWHEEKIVGYTSNRKLQAIYAKDADLIVPFYCQDYLKKNWCGVELRTIEALLQDQQYDRILPFRFDTAEIPGSFATDVFPLINDRAPEDVARLILERYNSLPGTTLTLPDSSTASATSPLVKADISRIVKYAPAELIGREAETELLNDAWARVRQHEAGRPRILTFVALGGEGKTSLVAKWAADLAAQDWPGCSAVFAWSFYSQGTREQVAASSDLFLNEALLFFGNEADKAFATGGAGAYEKGHRLAHIVGQRRNILILDGLEPLQCAPNSPTPGELKDQGIAALLKRLAANCHGLCIVTTRYSIPDLRTFWKSTAPEKRLTRLSRRAGVDLLKQLGVRRESGSPEEFEKLVEEVKGHALTLQIVGGFLKRAFGGDIRYRDRVEFEKADDKIDGGHAFRAVGAYVKWMEAENDKPRRELAILRLMGLFDRPASYDCLKALLDSPTIAGLTEPLNRLAEHDWHFCLDSLESASLLTINRDCFGAVLSLDTHPHIREFFSTQLRESNPGAWRRAHQRLYEYLYKTTQDKKQPTLEELQPLYQAVAHGCAAGIYKEAYASVFYDRILRKDEYYSVMHLGAVQSDIGAMTGFLSVNGTFSSANGIDGIEKACFLKHLGYCLRAAGRLDDSVGFLTSSYEQYDRCGLPSDAVNALGILCSAQIFLGRLDDAFETADREASLAETTGSLWARTTALSRLAEVALYKGDYEVCRTYLDRAFESFDTQPSFESAVRLYIDTISERDAKASVVGCLIRRCEFFAAYGKFDEAILLAEIVEHLMGSVVKVFPNDLHFGLVNVFNGQAQMGQAQRSLDRVGMSAETEITAYFNQAEKCFKMAEHSFRNGSRIHELPRPLISMAKLALLRVKSGQNTELELQQRRLDEAWEIAFRGSMQLHMADIHLYRAWLFFREAYYPWDKNEHASPRGPKDDLAAARKLMEKCGYWRRKEELEDAELVILGSIRSSKC